MLFRGEFSIVNTDGTDGIHLLGLGFTSFLLLHGISRLLTRPNGSALWKPATFEKVDKAFSLGLVDTVLACCSLTLASSISFLMCLLGTYKRPFNHDSFPFSVVLTLNQKSALGLLIR